MFKEHFATLLLDVPAWNCPFLNVHFQLKAMSEQRVWMVLTAWSDILKYNINKVHFSLFYHTQ